VRNSKLIAALLGLAGSLDLASCAHSNPAPAPRPSAVAAEMRFVVGSTDGGMLPDVEVFLVNSQGRLVLLGKTDQSGDISVPKGILREASAVLFCKPDYYFCGAFRIDDPAFSPPGFLAYNEHFIKLAPLSLL
jgi:hypothetical protein